MTHSQQPAGSSKRRLLLLVVIPFAAALIGILVYLQGGRYMETDNAYVKADKLPVSSEISGIVEKVMVTENQAVEAGQLLLKLEPAPFQMAVTKAEAKLAQVRVDLSALQASYRAQQAQISLAQTQWDFAQKDQRRQSNLIAQQFVSTAKFDDAKQRAEVAAEQIHVLQLDAERIAAALGGVDSPIEQHPSYLAAQAELAQARLDLSRTEVHAAVAGVVSKLPKPGQYLAAGVTALALVANQNLWIEANYTEADLTYVRPGEPVAISIDTYPGATWTGKVESLSPATGAEFALIPAQNATGNWVKIAQRLAVRIQLDNNPSAPSLKAGMSAEVEIDTGHKRRLLNITL